MDLQAVADKLEIHELLARYARAVDTKDWALYRSVFTPDATIDYSSAGAVAGTRDEVAEWLEDGFVHIPMTQHFISNVEVELDGDRATVRALFDNPMQLPGMSDLSYCGGTYGHDLIRTGDGWKSRRLVEENLWFIGRPGEAASAS